MARATDDDEVEIDAASMPETPASVYVVGLAITGRAAAPRRQLRP
jgi:hypothetical protein